MQQKLKAIGDNIFIEEIGIVSSTIIQVVSDKKKTYRRGKVLSVGEDIVGLKAGDVVIFTDAVPSLELEDEQTKEKKNYYIGNNDSIYCRCV